MKVRNELNLNQRIKVRTRLRGRQCERCEEEVAVLDAYQMVTPMMQRGKVSYLSDTLVEGKIRCPQCGHTEPFCGGQPRSIFSGDGGGTVARGM